MRKREREYERKRKREGENERKKERERPSYVKISYRTMPESTEFKIYRQRACTVLCIWTRFVLNGLFRKYI